MSVKTFFMVIGAVISYTVSAAEISCCTGPTTYCKQSGIYIGGENYCCPSGGSIQYTFQSSAKVSCSCGKPQECSTPQHDKNVSFKCLSGETIPLSAVDDDFCDCPDGSDEPNTSACSPKWRFLCKNDGYKPTLIRTSHVRDGICDCCDGSDEIDITCPNTCSTLQKEREERKLARDQKLAAGFVKKRVMFEKKRSALETLRMDESSRKEKVEKQDLELKQLKLIVDSEERKENDEREIRKQKLVNGELEKTLLLHTHSNSILESLISKMILLAGEATAEIVLNIYQETDAGNSILNSDDFMDTEVLDYVARQQVDQEQESTGDLTDASTKLVDLLQLRKITNTEELAALARKVGMVSNQLSYLADEAKKLLENDTLNENEIQEALALADFQNFELQSAKLARFNLKEGENKKSDLEMDLENVAKVAKMNFGPEDTMYLLYNECFEKKFSTYKYKLCPFDSLKQAFTNIGRFSKVEYFAREENEEDEEEAEFYSVAMSFSGGQNCHNVGPRSGVVYFTCGPENDILDVEEPSTCEYVFKVSSPAACYGKIDLDEHLIKIAEENERSFFTKTSESIKGALNSVYKTVESLL